VKVQFAELINFLNTYVKNGEDVVGLKDLIAALNAIKNSNASVLEKIVEVSNNHTASIQTLQNDVTNIKSNNISTSDIDARIKAWLSKVTIVADGESGYKLNVPDSI